MNARDRVLIALDGDEPDRIPLALGFYHVDIPSLVPPGRYRDDLVDVEFIEFPCSSADEELEQVIETRAPAARLGSPSQVRTYALWDYHPENLGQGNPLAHARSLEDLENFPLPDLNGPCGVEQLTLQVEALHERGLAAGGNPPHLGGELFETAWRLRGFKNFLVDLVRRPEWADLLLDRLTDRARRHTAALAKAGVDVLALDDDIGMPKTMIISPATWRRFFKPRLADIIRAARAILPSVRVLYHSDGYFEPVIGDLVEIGVNAINPVQPDHMDALRIRRAFGPKLALWGTVGRQTTFSFATAQEIRKEVRQRIEALGRAGLVLCPAYDIDEPDIPWQNVAAFVQAVRDYG